MEELKNIVSSRRTQIFLCQQFFNLKILKSARDILQYGKGQYRTVGADLIKLFTPRK